jgi:hypothetical protein
MPSPLLDKGKVRESHLTLGQVLDALPPQMKLQTTPLTWLHILGLEFQQAARYHIEESSTWLATRILLARENLQLPHAIIFPFRECMSLSKFGPVGSQKPIWMPRYRTPSPLGIHFSLTSCPHSHSLFSLLAHMAIDFSQLTLAPNAR